jgi:HEPN domain-containing protein
MSTDEQAEAYLAEAELTYSSAKAIYDSATENEENLWAQVVKNGYDAMEQAVSAGIAAMNETIPRPHPAKTKTFIELHDPADEIEDALLYWLRRRSDVQYVDIRGDELNVPHRQFDRNDAERILGDANQVIEFVEKRIGWLITMTQHLGVS